MCGNKLFATTPDTRDKAVKVLRQIRPSVRHSPPGGGAAENNSFQGSEGLHDAIGDEEVDDVTARKKVQCEFRASVLEPGRHLFPVHCPECVEHPGGHWTRRGLERKEAGAEVSVRDCDTHGQGE